MKRALIYIAAAAGCVIAGGLLLGVTEHMSAGNGVYCGLGTAATVGCTPGIPVAARIVSIVLMLTAIPLFALAYGSLSSAHLRKHMTLHRVAMVAEVKDELDSVRKHVTTEVGGLHRRLDDHADLIRATAARNADTSPVQPVVPPATPPGRKPRRPVLSDARPGGTT